MATLTKDELLDAIASMTVIEVSELVSAMEERFGVSAAAPVAMAATGGASTGGGEEEVEEQTEFNVILKGFAEGKKIPVIKEVRALTGLGLGEAKALVEAGGKKVKEAVTKEQAQQAKEKLETAGAVVELQ